MGLMQIRRMSGLGERQGVFTPWEEAGFLGDHPQQRMQALGSHFLSPLWALAAPSRAFSLVTWWSVLDLDSGFLQSFRSTEHVSTELKGESMSWHVVGFSHKDEDIT